MTLGDSLVKDMLDITVADHKPLQDKWQHRVGAHARNSGGGRAHVNSAEIRKLASDQQG
jgi:hypothetical protein